jgi:hypothetical protein
MLAKRQSAPPPHSFPRTIRRDQRLNLTARLAWLMVSVAYKNDKNGFCSMKPERLADELDATPAAVRRARQKLVEFGFFAPPQRWRYARIMLPGEDRKSHWKRIRADRRLDLTARCAWALADMTRNGEAEISLTEIGAALGTTRKRASLAVNRVLALGHFSVTKGGGGRFKNTYQRHGDAASQVVQLFQQEVRNDDEGFDVGDYFRQRFPSAPSAPPRRGPGRDVDPG